MSRVRKIAADLTDLEASQPKKALTESTTELEEYTKILAGLLYSHLEGMASIKEVGEGKLSVSMNDIEWLIKINPNRVLLSGFPNSPNLEQYIGRVDRERPSFDVLSTAMNAAELIHEAMDQDEPLPPVDFKGIDRQNEEDTPDEDPTLVDPNTLGEDVNELDVPLAGPDGAMPPAQPPMPGAMPGTPPPQGPDGALPPPGDPGAVAPGTPAPPPAAGPAAPAPPPAMPVASSKKFATPTKGTRRNRVAKGVLMILRQQNWRKHMAFLSENMNPPKFDPDWYGVGTTEVKVRDPNDREWWLTRLNGLGYDAKPGSDQNILSVETKNKTQPLQASLKGSRGMSSRRARIASRILAYGPDEGHGSFAKGPPKVHPTQDPQNKEFFEEMRRMREKDFQTGLQMRKDGHPDAPFGTDYDKADGGLPAKPAPAPQAPASVEPEAEAPGDGRPGRMVRPNIEYFNLNSDERPIDYGHVHDIFVDKYGPTRGERMYETISQGDFANSMWTLASAIQKEKKAMLHALGRSGEKIEDVPYFPLWQEWKSKGLHKKAKPAVKKV
jgi:hypothetical protein